MSRARVNLDAEGQRLQAEHARAKQAFDTAVTRAQMKNQPTWKKMATVFTQAERAIKLTGATTLAKISGATGARIGLTPIEEAVGGLLSHVPIISKVAARAPREGGFSARAEGAALGGAVKGARQFFKVLGTGHSDLDALFGQGNKTPHNHILDAPGALHGAISAPAQYGEFARSMVKRATAYDRMGFDTSSSVMQGRIAAESYRDSQRAVFAQQNFVSQGYRNLIRFFENNKLAPNAGFMAAKALDFLFPVVKKPLNIVGEGLTYLGGTASASVRLVNAMRNGLDKLEPAQADLIMRELKKGLVGNALLALGYFGASAIGGQYQKGEKRDKDDVQPGDVRINGVTIPKHWMENPAFMTLNVGATIRRVSDQRDRSTGALKGIGAGALASTLGIVHDVPFVSSSDLVSQLTDPNKSGSALGRFVKSNTIPAGLSQAAEYLDLHGDVKRSPKGVVQSIESGIPDLSKYTGINLPSRSDVPYAMHTADEKLAAWQAMTPQQQEVYRQQVAAKKAAADDQRNSPAARAARQDQQNKTQRLRELMQQATP